LTLDDSGGEKAGSRRWREGKERRGFTLDDEKLDPAIFQVLRSAHWSLFTGSVGWSQPLQMGKGDEWIGEVVEKCEVKGSEVVRRGR
jgi:hypothetical protein